MCGVSYIGYSHDVDGYCIPSRNIELGRCYDVAKNATGSTQIPKHAQNLGISKDGKFYQLGHDVSIEKARVIAAGGGEILKAVARNNTGLKIWKRIEKIDDNPTGAMVDDTGVVLCKVGRPGDQLSSIAGQLASELVYEDRKWIKPYMQKYLSQLNDIDWEKEKDVASAFAKAQRVLRAANVVSLFKPWTERVEISAKVSARDGKQWLKQAFMPRISGSLTGADKKAVERIATQQGWFLRDQMGLRSDRLTARGREIVQAGLKDGLGRQAIADQLKLAMPDLWNKYGNNYAQVNAAVAVNRARSFSMWNSYQEAGIEELEIVAVLDERTTEQCRFMDGQILVVSDVGDVLNNVVNMKQPEDIYHTNPFIHVRRGENGLKELITARGDKLAEITRSGYGIRDDRGAHRQFVSGRAMPKTTAIGMPPYHHLCRTTTIPVYRTFQVPSGYMQRTVPGPSPIPQTIYNQGRIAATRAMKPADRPITLVKEPTKRTPTQVGYTPPKEGDPLDRIGLDSQVDLVGQVEGRIERAIFFLQQAVTEEVRKNAGRSLSQKRKGEVLKKAIRGGAGKKNFEKANYNVVLSGRERGDMPYAEQRKIITLIKRVLGERLFGRMARRNFPRVIESTSTLRPVGIWDGKVFVLPRSGTSRANAVIIETVTKYLDEFGKNGQASVLARNGSCIGGKITNDEGTFLKTRGSDWMCGRVYGDVAGLKVSGPWDVSGGSDSESDWASTAVSASTDGQEERLALMWDMNPDQVAFAAAYIEGQFV